ncbi:STN domain-containing protein [Stieleria varia]|nr:STN domain-containing protein [Stieleria varia]
MKNFDNVRLGGLGASHERLPREQSKFEQLLDRAYQPSAGVSDAGSPTDEATLHKYRPYRATRRTQVEDKIHKMLQQPTLKSIKKLPLAEVAEQFARFHDVKIDIDPLWLEDETPDLNQPVSTDLGDLSLGAALDFILEPLGMSYIVRDDEIRITSIDRAEAYQYERVHELPPPLKGQEEQVIQALTTKITPESWWLVGGEYVASATDGWLTISANREVHEAAAALLEEWQTPKQQRSLPELGVPSSQDE